MSADDVRFEGRVLALPDAPEAAQRILDSELGRDVFSPDQVDEALDGVSEALVISLSWTGPQDALGRYRIYFDVPGYHHLLTRLSAPGEVAVGSDQIDREVFRQRRDIAAYRQHAPDDQVFAWSADVSSQGTLHVLLIPVVDDAERPDASQITEAAVAYVPDEEPVWIEAVPLKVAPR